MEKACIFVTTFNRKKITEKCLSILDKYVDREKADIHINDDGSTEYDANWIKTFNPNTITQSERIGVFRIMTERIARFCESDEYEYLYITNNDILHDEYFFDKAFELYKSYNTPVTLYRTKYHLNNQVYDDENISFLKSFPGASVFFSKNDVKNIDVEKLKRYEGFSWDWHFGYILNKQFVCPKISYCDHFPEGGIHATIDDVAENPTEFLKNERRVFYDE